MTAPHTTLDDRIAMVAACTTLGFPAGSRNRHDVLSNQEWNLVALWLAERQLRPADLLLLSASELAESKLDPQLAMKTSAVADRASVVALEMEQLERVGIWTLSRIDDGYPLRWRSILRGVAPPVIFGAGPWSLLDRESIAIVGSREITDELSEIANALGSRIAQAGMAVVSGGARGSDKVGMYGALQVEGCAVGVLPADLGRLSRNRDVRDFIANEQLCLVSQVNPDAGFSVGNAMARNRLIYALSELTIVVSTAEGSGGTWAGATENLKRGWAPIAVWTGSDAPDGNQRLIERCAYPLASIPGSADEVHALVAEATVHFRTRVTRSEKSPAMQLGFAVGE